jgi:integrase
MLIRRDQVDLAAGVIRIGSKQAKGKRQRVVPLYGDMRPYIELALADDPRGSACLIQRDGQALTHGKLKGAWSAAAKVAGVRVLPHDLRRTALTNMTAAGIPQHEAMQISGHKSATVFERYLISSERTAKAVGERMAEWMQSTAEPVRKERAN